MAIKIQTAHKDSVEELNSHLLLHGAPSNKDELLEMPHKVYEMTLSDITSRKGIDGARFAGWRYPFKNQAGRLRAVEIRWEENTGHTIHKIDRGSHLAAFAKAVDNLHTHELVEQYHYNINYLRITDCDVLAIWLTGDDHHHEMVIPLDSAVPELVPGEFYSVQSFIHTLEFIAREYCMEEEMLEAITGINTGSVSVDNLTQIEGIGPKLAEILKAAGYTSFKAIASASAAELKKVLNAAGSPYNMTDPKTWPMQAKLAADSKWEALDKLQEKLKRN